MKQNYRYEFLYRPSLSLRPEEIRKLNGELRDVARQCFPEVPEYQCLEDDPTSLSDKVLMLARDPEGNLAGFCSALLLSVEGIGRVLHLGLTCVKPGSRGHGLTHFLTSKLVTRYLLTRHPVGKVWVTNLACVLSSLGNVALHFDNVFPSPFGTMVPDAKQERIALAVDRHFRRSLYIHREARFDPRFFVFRGSVKGTVFQKNPADSRYLHRSRRLNKFYADLMDFEEGDEVLQVGTVSLWTGMSYAFKRLMRFPLFQGKQAWAWQTREVNEAGHVF